MNMLPSDQVVPADKSGPGRSLDECIALVKAHSSGATIDDDFGRDIEEMIALRKPLDTSAWD